MSRLEYWYRRVRGWWVGKLIVNRARNLRLDMDYQATKDPGNEKD